MYQHGNDDGAEEDDDEVIQGIWVPKLVFSNTEGKDNTLNDDKAFTVARYRIANSLLKYCS